LADLCVREKANGAIGHALSLVLVVEGEQVVVRSTGEAVVKAETGCTLGITLTAGTTLPVEEEGSRARIQATTLV
jgi:hypothetical protein